MCLSLIATMLLVAAWLGTRRLAGEMLAPLGFFTLFSVGAILAGIVSAVRYVEVGSAIPTMFPPWRRVLLRWLPGLAMLLMASVLTLPGTSVVAAVALWSCVAINESWWVWLWRRGRVARMPAVAFVPHGEYGPSQVASPRVETDLPERGTDPLDEGELPLPNEVSQQITRTQTGPQDDTLSGLLRAVFQPGERSRYLHVAICPPMSGRPNVEVVQLSGPGTRVKAAEIQSFGVRFDLRLLATSTREETVLIHFEACCPD